MPIIIGSFEAQAIALELENIKPPRPMTHDLLKNLIVNFESEIKHVVIDELREGTFYAKVVIEKEFELLEIDARPSDAIALAVRFGSTIFVEESVLKEAGISAEPEPKSEEKSTVAMNEVPTTLSKLEKLELDLRTAIETENYEKAAKLRDQIQKFKG